MDKSQQEWYDGIVELLSDPSSRLEQSLLQWCSLQDALRDLPNADSNGWGDSSYLEDRCLNRGRLLAPLKS